MAGECCCRVLFPHLSPVVIDRIDRVDRVDVAVVIAARTRSSSKFSVDCRSTRRSGEGLFDAAFHRPLQKYFVGDQPRSGGPWIVREIHLIAGFSFDAVDECVEVSGR